MAFSPNTLRLFSWEIFVLRATGPVTCPGCGRHDWVDWPANSPTYPWKCFNCGKQFALERGGRH